MTKQTKPFFVARAGPEQDATGATIDRPPLPDALAKFDYLPDSACVREPVVRALFQCSSATVWRWSNSDRLPRPLKLGPRLTVWNVGELRRVLAARSDERC